MSTPADTSPEAQAILTRIQRGQSPQQKWQILCGACRLLRVLHAAGVRLRRPEATTREILEDWIHRVLEQPNIHPGDGPVMDPTEIGIADLRHVTRLFDRLGITWALGGSMASSIHGVPRATQDADVTVDTFSGREQQLIAGLGPAYYLSPDAVRDAHHRHTSFNIIHTLTGFKVDVFVCPPAGIARSALERRLAIPLPDAPDEPLQVITPEDVVLMKLDWYRLGNETSDRQWQDILGVLRTKAGSLDEGYLSDWAARLGVLDLLERARRESQP